MNKPNLMDIELNSSSNECPVLCSICGGECCRTKPGIDSPERVLVAADPELALHDLLASGKWVLDRHRGTPIRAGVERTAEDADRIIYYPRPATSSEYARGVLLTMEGEGAGECVFLDPDVCSLSFEERPKMCRSLEPEVNFECWLSWTRLDAALAWLPWQELVSGVLRRLQDGDGAGTGESGQGG